ncbi:MAG: hypothetical protein HYZ53_02095 [Planctomycetes bacterium]|nr:hypothetical protein [Planctomycetota bacterium]
MAEEEPGTSAETTSPATGAEGAAAAEGQGEARRRFRLWTGLSLVCFILGLAALFLFHEEAAQEFLTTLGGEPIHDPVRVRYIAWQGVTAWIPGVAFAALAKRVGEGDIAYAGILFNIAGLIFCAQIIVRAHA